MLHLDATLRAELIRPYLRHIAVREPVTATTPHVRVRQVLGGPTSAKALTPGAQAPERDRTTAAHHLRDLLAYVAYGPASCTGPDATLTCCSSARRPRSTRCVPPAFLRGSTPSTSMA